MVISRVPLSSQYSNEDVVGKWVKIISKSSKHKGMFAKVLGVSEGRLNCLDVYVRETDSRFHICRKSVELVN